MGRILSFLRWISLAGLIAAIAGVLIKAWVPDDLGGIVGTALKDVPAGAIAVAVLIVALVATAAGRTGEDGAADDTAEEDPRPW